MNYLQNLFNFEWVQTRSPGGAVQWIPADGQASNLVPDAHENAYEFHYIVRGNLDWWACDDSYRVKPGMVFMTRPGEMHGSSDSFFQRTELYWFQLAVPKSRPMAGLSKAETDFIRTRLGAMSERMFAASNQIRPAFECILDEHRFPSSSSRMRCGGRLSRGPGSRTTRTSSWPIAWPRPRP